MTDKQTRATTAGSFLIEFTGFREFDKMSISNFCATQKDIVDKHFYGCKFRDCRFRGSDFSECDFKIHREHGRIGTTFSDCDFSGCVIFHTDFNGCAFTDCTFDGSHFYKVDFSCVTFEKCSMRGARMDNVNLISANFKDCDTQGVEWPFEGLDVQCKNKRQDTSI